MLWEVGFPVMKTKTRSLEKHKPTGVFRADYRHSELVSSGGEVVNIVHLNEMSGIGEVASLARRAIPGKNSFVTVHLTVR
jgi:hypothetical protein